MASSRTDGYFAAAMAQHLLDLCAWHGIPVAQLLADRGITREMLAFRPPADDARRPPAA